MWRWAGFYRVAPLVVVQIAVGLALGPTLLGRAWPEAWDLLFAPERLAVPGRIGEAGAALFAFLAGMHLDPAALRGRGRAFAAIGAGSVLAPAALGLVAGAALVAAYPDLAGPSADPAIFALALALAVAVTALPVLAAILDELELAATRLGQWALALAAANDAALWAALALLLAVVAGTVAPWIAFLGAVAYAAVMAVLVPPLLRWVARCELGPFALLAAAVVVVALSSAATGALGLHAILGAFVAGVVMPPAYRAAIPPLIQRGVVFLLLPFFFLTTGLKTEIVTGEGPMLLVVAVTAAAAIAGKVLGTALPARACGEPWRFALALGALMQTKGLMEVLVLTVLRDARLIGTTAFSALILTALLTTVLAAPFARAALGRAEGEQPGA